MLKPYDGAFKSLAARDTSALLAMLGEVEPGTKAGIKNKTRRIRASHLDPDLIASIMQGGIERAVHYEAFARWKSAIPERMHDYAWFYFRETGKAPKQTVLLFKPDDLPKKFGFGETFEFTYEFRDGGLWGGVTFRLLMLWRMNPEHAFRVGRDSTLPWVLLMNSTERDIERVFERVEELSKTDRKAAAELAAEIVAVGGLRYAWNELENTVFRKVKMYIKREVMQESSFVQHLLAEGKATGKVEGKAEGKVEGKAEGKAESILGVLEARFPDLGAIPQLKNLHSLGADALDSLLRAVATAKDTAAARKAIRGLTH